MGCAQCEVAQAFVWNPCTAVELCSCCTAFAHIRTHGGALMNITVSLGPLVSLIAGILILVVPRLLNYIVAVYLILMGLIGLFGLRI